MLPESLSRNPVAIGGAGVLLLGAVVYLLFFSGAPPASSHYVCGSCNKQFDGVPDGIAPPKCPACGSTETGVPHFVRCPNGECKRKLFEAYRTRPNAIAIQNSRNPPGTPSAGGAMREYQAPGGGPWHPEELATGSNPAAEALVSPPTRKCPTCGHVAANPEFRPQSYVPLD